MLELKCRVDERGDTFEKNIRLGDQSDWVVKIENLRMNCRFRFCKSQWTVTLHVGSRLFSSIIIRNIKLPSQPLIPNVSPTCAFLKVTHPLGLVFFSNPCAMALTPGM